MKKTLIEMKNIKSKKNMPSVVNAGDEKSYRVRKAVCMSALTLIQYASMITASQVNDYQMQYDNCVDSHKTSASNHNHEGRGLFGPMNFPRKLQQPRDDNNCVEQCLDSCYTTISTANLSFLLSTTVMVCLIVLTGESIVNICSTKKQNSEAFSADETEKLADASTPLKSSTEAQATLQYV
jgi:hypothetical protein